MMTDDVELFVNARIRPEEVADIRAELQDWGWDPQVRRMPVRRGAELTWLLLLTIPAEIVMKTMLEHLGTQLYQSVRNFVQRRLRPDQDTAPVPGRVVVIESADTGARFALGADLPVEAYQQMLEVLAGSGAADGLRSFDRARGRWVEAGT